MGLLLIFASTFSSCKLDKDDEEKMPGDKFWSGSPANAEAFMLSTLEMYVVHLLQDRVLIIICI